MTCYRENTKKSKVLSPDDAGNLEPEDNSDCYKALTLETFN